MELMRLPQLGMTMESAEIVRWLKQESDPVSLGEPIAEIQTEKAVVVVEAASEGILVRRMAKVGETVLVDAPFALIATAAETVSEEAINTFLGVTEGPVTETASQPASLTMAATPASTPAGQGRATPRVRKLAQELQIDLAQVTPTGPGGVVTEEDLRRYTRVETATPPPTAHVRERVPLTGIRKAMASHMAASWQTIPHFHQILDVNAGPLLAFRKNHPYSFTPFFVRAAALALEKNPFINSVVEGNELLLMSEINVGVAVASPHGLVVPVIRGANRKDLQATAAALAELSLKAKEGRLSPEDLSGGTFTVSNLGMYGIESGFPIINSPQVALLFTGAIQTVPVMHEGQVVEGKRFKITVSFDHRVVDGVSAAEFSRDLQLLLQDPIRLATL